MFPVGNDLALSYHYQIIAGEGKGRFHEILLIQKWRAIWLTVVSTE